MVAMKPGQGKADYPGYLQERQSLINALLDQSRSFDKHILTLAAGSFGLSLLFIQRIAPILKADTKWLLITAWGTLGISIVTTLFSFLFSQEACLRELEILKQSLDGGTEELGNGFTKATKWLNWFSMVVFVLGVAFLMLFAMQNIFP